MRKKIFIRFAVVLVFFLAVGLGFNGRDALADRALAQENLESNPRFSLPSAVIQEQSALAHSPQSYSGYTQITDNEEKIIVQVPVEWSDIETGAWTFKGKPTGVFLAASADLGNFYSSHSQSGVLIGVSRSLAQTYDKDGLLGVEKRELSRQCAYKGRFDYKNQFYSGKYDHFAGCASGTPGLFVFTTSSADQKSLIMIRIAVVSEADLEAVDTIINTFQVLGDPERDDHHDE
ncbi:MAG TPA: hypothetical protein VFY83_10900 [Anaerolineales bacterium]|jgi:hypothetical protein|nr:hypothetical protein [Anaerolineales bacterium]